MIAFPLSDLAALLGGELLGRDLEVASVSTDTRTLQPGDLFVALSGPHFDGHDYLDMAAERGACAALVGRARAHVLPQLRVNDPRQALGQLAREWRKRATARVVAITGSNGKTTVKEMLASVLGRLGPTLATRGNLNNDIGVPLTLIRLQEERFAVVELGASHRGEIRYLSDLVCPDVAVLNNAGRAHLEGFGSLEAVARAKAEIVQGLPPEGVFVLNADDRFASLWRELADGRRILDFGVNQPAALHSPPGSVALTWDAEGFRSRFPVASPAGEFELELRLGGHHNRLNALAAAAAALAAGADVGAVQSGLNAVAPVRGRLCPCPGRDGLRLVDDSYNANPDSVAAAIAVLAAAPGRRTLVLGDLAELGPEAMRLHAGIGEEARAAGIDRLWSCGQLSESASASFGPGGRHFAAQQALIDALCDTVGAEDSVLIKGSRSARMERVVAALTEEVA